MKVSYKDYKKESLTHVVNMAVVLVGRSKNASYYNKGGHMSDQYQNDESLELLDALEIGIILSDYIGSDSESE